MGRSQRGTNVPLDFLSTKHRLFDPQSMAYKIMLNYTIEKRTKVSTFPDGLHGS